jgi:putative ABC transport system permease protein
MQSIWQDARYCLRTLRKSPGFTAVVILTLALGIGANTAIFSVVDAVLLRGLPFPHPEQLVRIVMNAPGAGVRDIGLSVPELNDLQDRAGLFDGVSATWPVDANVTGAGKPERIELLAVSPNYFALLGAHAQIGRVFGTEDRAAGFSESCVISDGLWRRSFGADPSILGKRIRGDGDAYTVVGVMPPGFRHPGRTLATEVDVWATAGFEAAPFPTPLQRGAAYLPGAIGRLRDGLTLEQAQLKMDAFAAQLRAQYPTAYRPAAHWSIALEPLKDTVTGNVRPLLYTLLAATAMMLMIGCVNIANLLLARAAGRQREIAIRQSMGAAHGRLVRQLLTESVILSLAAGIAGVAISVWGLKLLLYLAPSRLPRQSEIAVDGRVLLFAFALCLITGLLFGLAPALQTASLDLSERLKASSRGSAGGTRRQGRTSAILVAAEFAICLMLMTGAGLLTRSFWKLTETNPGFNPSHSLVARIWLPQPNDPSQDQYAQTPQRSAFVREVLRRVRTLPGVTSAAMSTTVPLSARPTARPIRVENRDPRPSETTLAETIGVSPEYFRAIGTPLVQGRFLDENDQGSALVAVVDRAAAQRFWPGESPIGKRISLARQQPNQAWFSVVGVVGDVRDDAIDTGGAPHVYLSIYQFSGKTMGLEVRTGQDPAPLGEPLRREVQAVDPTLPVFAIRTMDEMVSASLAPHRFPAQLMGAFAALALLLSGIGIYGVLAYFVGQRTREIGLRMALGAAAGSVVRMVLWQGMRPIAAGMIAGVTGSLALSNLLSGLLYGVSASDPLVLSSVAVALLFAALVASYLPARRATRIHPTVALRCE